MQFDELIDLRGTHSMKWDQMEARYGIPAGEGLPMWVADMDFRVANPIRNAVSKLHERSVYGYFGGDEAYRAAIQWWMQERHGWSIDTDSIFSTHGLVNAIGLLLNAFTKPGDGIVIFTPVYHAFARVIEAAGRRVIECPLALVDGRYALDFDAYSALIDKNARMVIHCSPHNPGGRVWSHSELEAVGDFAKHHDLLLVSDEIHHDLTMPGQTHIPMAKIAGLSDRLITLTAASKTFNIAGGHTGNVIIDDDGLHAIFSRQINALGISPNSFGLHMVTAAYSPEGATWVDAVRAYIDENRQAFDAAINDIPGLTSMPLEATYLAWVDFEDTGMTREEFTDRVERGAKIAVNHGTTFGKGGESFLRFNLAAPRARVEEAIKRMREAFSDLQ